MKYLEESGLQAGTRNKFSADVDNQDIYPKDRQIKIFEESDITLTMNSEVV